jgi:hypothetical protein
MRLRLSRGVYRCPEGNPYVCEDAGQRLGWGDSVELEVKSTPAPGFTEVSMVIDDMGITTTVTNDFDEVEFEDAFPCFHGFMHERENTIYYKEVGDASQEG